LTSRKRPEFPSDLALMATNLEDVFDKKRLKEVWKRIQKKPELYADYFEIPSSFDEAWNHEDEFQRLKWREAILKELEKMERLRVWIKIKRSQMPVNRRCVKFRWIFAIKRNGKFRARLVACGYSQIPGIDFNDNYSPVVNDVTYRVLLILKMLLKLGVRIIDVETAFLYGILEEEIYMECPNGL